MNEPSIKEKIIEKMDINQRMIAKLATELCDTVDEEIYDKFIKGCFVSKHNKPELKSAPIRRRANPSKCYE